MIAVVCHIKEGRDIIQLIKEKGLEVVALTDTAYGKKLIAGAGVEVYSGDITETALTRIFQDNAVRALVDVTHPYSHNLSKMLQQVCDDKQVEYIRYLRAETDLPDSSLIYPVTSWQEAAKFAQKLGDTIFLTTGSNNLKEFLNWVDTGKKRVVVRVLPDHKIIKKCQDLGLSPKDIVGMQGPFSKQINKATFKMYNASVIVTKDSGREGGTDTKIAAALDLKIPVVVLKRPFLQHGRSARSYDEIISFVSKYRD
ncbi:MAG: precorrin-6A reductase [Thermoanaerobacteraceae bacterium]|nr:precorrin-6A reductase [Thermoanaerobacteraceae bacterium]